MSGCKKCTRPARCAGQDLSIEQKMSIMKLHDILRNPRLAVDVKAEAVARDGFQLGGLDPVFDWGREALRGAFLWDSRQRELIINIIKNLYARHMRENDAKLAASVVVPYRHHSPVRPATVVTTRPRTLRFLSAREDSGGEGMRRRTMRRRRKSLRHNRGYSRGHSRGRSRGCSRGRSRGCSRGRSRGHSRRRR